jgi:hypothetical protein
MHIKVPGYALYCGRNAWMGNLCEWVRTQGTCRSVAITGNDNSLLVSSFAGKNKCRYWQVSVHSQICYNEGDDSWASFPHKHGHACNWLKHGDSQLGVDSVVNCHPACLVSYAKLILVPVGTFLWGCAVDHVRDLHELAGTVQLCEQQCWWEYHWFLLKSSCDCLQVWWGRVISCAEFLSMNIHELVDLALQLYYN